MIRIHTETFVPKYETGVWGWNEAENRLDFKDRKGATFANEEYISTNFIQFRRRINQLEEVVFRQEFQRKANTHDGDVILISDVRNLVLFLSPMYMLRKDFLKFIHMRIVTDFFKTLVIYFEYFLKVAEFIIIRNDEMTSSMPKMQSNESIKMRKTFASRLSQYRILLAREYSRILCGLEETKPYYHTHESVKITRTIWDRDFHEWFIAFSTQLVWICMHRRSYDVIDMEMGRLFRSEHFQLRRFDNVEYTVPDQRTLYGKNYRRTNYRVQNSALVQELSNVDRENEPVLWFGKRKYRGNDLRILQMELECIVPESQLALIGISYGILGHPKKLYNTLLQIDWEAVRFQNYSESYDPYRIITQPRLELPDLNEEAIRKRCKTYESFFELKYHEEKIEKGVLKKWATREDVVEYFRTGGVIVNPWILAERELKSTSYGPSVEEIMARFLRDKEKLQKKK